MIKSLPVWWAAHVNSLRQELEVTLSAPAPPVDIIIVVHNQLDYLKKCLESIKTNTQEYNIFLWDNASNEETKDWLTTQKDIRLYTSKTNEGFIKPNNHMVWHGNNPYVILLNSDTYIRSDKWVAAMTNWLKTYPEVGAVGYEGGLLDENGRGTPEMRCGSLIDYVQGWCLCIPRWILAKTGLFDQDNLKFAYCEDADLCLRLKEKGYSIYALHLYFVEHFGQKTTKSLTDEAAIWQKQCFVENHEYMKARWGKFLQEKGQNHFTNGHFVP